MVSSSEEDDCDLEIVHCNNNSSSEIDEDEDEDDNENESASSATKRKTEWNHNYSEDEFESKAKKRKFECGYNYSEDEHDSKTEKRSVEWSNSYSEDDFESDDNKTKLKKRNNHEQSNYVEKFSYVDKGLRLIQQMGYEGGGLGKRGDGIIEPVAAAAQEGRRGLGLKLEGLDAAAMKWSQDMEKIEIPEPMYWLKNETDGLDRLSLDDLAHWIVLGDKKMTIDDETKFCDPEILANVLSSKSVFDKLEGIEMRNARTRSNPFETIKGNIFLNRAAVKMANIDSLCDFMFTNPVDEQGNSLVKDNDLLYFADICAGPGGFSEYVLYRRGWEARGFGFTLKGEHDFKLEDFFAGPPETFDPYYGTKGNGDIYDPENQTSFKNYVMKQTDGLGVHFVMADGGFSVKNQENIQEILSKQLYLCQCLVALSVLRIKGHFVVKLFDLFTPFSVGLLYLMYKCFDEVSICKPNTSRPANSERYLICKWRRPYTEVVERHLFDINRTMWKNQDSSTDINELVNYDELSKDNKFTEYIKKSNNHLGQKQIIGLIKIAAFYKNPQLKETRQAECKKNCLEQWNLPDRIRKKIDVPAVDTLLEELLQDWSSDKQFLSHPPSELKQYSDLQKHIKSFYDWFFVPIGRDESEKNIRTIFLCSGRKSIYRYTANGNWQQVQDLNLEISPRTLLYGEIITELIGEGRSQNKIYALHIIDALVLGGKDIRRYSLDERNKMCEKFARALNKPYKEIEINDGNQQPYSPIRCKKLFALTEFQTFFDRMKMYKLKDNTNRLGYQIRSDDNRAERFFVPGGLMFFNKTNVRYLCLISKKTGHYYYFNTENGVSHYISAHPNPREFFGSFRSSYYYRLIWKWVNILQVKDNVDKSKKELGLLYKEDIFRFIYEFSTR